jgi:hypothetical protein
VASDDLIINPRQRRGTFHAVRKETGEVACGRPLNDIRLVEFREMNWMGADRESKCPECVKVAGIH